jgi:hypothetical protein
MVLCRPQNTAQGSQVSTLISRPCLLLTVPILLSVHRKYLTSLTCIHLPVSGRCAGNRSQG